MTDDRKRLAEFVRDAFRGVELGNGVGLWQGQEIDGYASSADVAAARSKDEKHDWSRIPAAELSKCQSSLSFFDADGIRFHLPAYLIADLEGTLEGDLTFALTSLDISLTSRFDKLNDLQHNAVRQYLLLLASEDPNNDFLCPIIEKALAEYWIAKSSA